MSRSGLAGTPDSLFSTLIAQRGRTLAVMAALITWTILVTGEILPDMNRVTQGFAAYYAASYAVLHGGATALTDDTVFPLWVIQSGISGIHEVFAGNAPTLALLMIPLTAFRPETAQTLWLIVNVGLLVLCTWLAGRICAPHNPTVRWWIMAVFALLTPVAETLRYGQVYLLLAFLSLITFAALRKRHDLLAGIAIGAMLLIKPYYGILSLGVLAWSRRPRSIGAAIVAAGLVVIGSLPLLAEAWPGFLPALFNVNDAPWAGIAANQTLNSLTQHLFLYTPLWNPEPLIDSPWLANGLRYGLLIVMVAITVRQAFKHNPLWLWPPALALMPILAPVGEIHHYTLLLLPIAVGITYLLERRPDRLTMGAIGLGLLLLIVAWPSLHSLIGWGGWNGLLAYPRLLGGVLLWVGVTVQGHALGATSFNNRR
ncbi:MAG: glycosyltransferase family 87 protein [Aggregatilineales bacterium]